MKIPLNDLRRNDSRNEEVLQVLAKVFLSGNWVHGTEHAEFENELSTYLAVRHVLGVASGTDALEIALRALGCTIGSKVITVANAGGYASIAGAAIGCEMIYSDIDSESLLMDPEKLKPLLSNEIKCVVVTHLYGNVARVNEIVEMCANYGIKVIEDCAQAIGGKENGNKVGTIGDIGTFSFYPTKNLGGIGDGGALSTNDDLLAEKILKLRQYGWSSKYRIEIPGGMNSRLDELQAGVLRIGLRGLDSRNDKRRQIVSKYRAALSGSSIRVVTNEHCGNVAHLAVLLFPKELPIDAFRTYFAELGIQTDVHYPILDTDQPGLSIKKFAALLETSISTNGRVVSIPLFPDMTDEEVEYVLWGLQNFADTI